MKSSPRSPQLEKARTQQGRPNTAINEWMNEWMNERESKQARANVVPDGDRLNERFLYLQEQDKDICCCLSPVVFSVV